MLPRVNYLHLMCTYIPGYKFQVHIPCSSYLPDIDIILISSSITLEETSGFPIFLKNNEFNYLI